MSTTKSDPEIVEAIVGAAFEVSNSLGAGFHEKIYERALIRELTERGFEIQSQTCYQVRYKGHLVGEYIPDLVVAGQIVVELKCVERFATEHIARCLNYLRVARLNTALLINFQHPKVAWRCVPNTPNFTVR